MKLLVLEDNVSLSKVIKRALEKEGYDIDSFDDGEKALNAIKDGYSCFILDINVPSLDGISVLKEIRSYYKDVPVLIMSSNHELDKIKSAYELACNDYIKKPFFIYELIQKVKSLCTIENKYLQFSLSCKYSFIEHVLYENGEKIILAKKEILFLELYIKNLNRVVSYEELETYVWEGEITNLDNIRALIKRLRKKLPTNSIKIVTGLGYTLSNEVKLV
ncbi:MAG: response regulator transcription factor [Campylobacterales bacterium]|nr:response regulator transcription factor [Campylobacterales bacterium]